MADSFSIGIPRSTLTLVTRPLVSTVASSTTTPATWADCAIVGYWGSTRCTRSGALICPPTRTGACPPPDESGMPPTVPPTTPPAIPPGTPPGTPSDGAAAAVFTCGTAICCGASTGAKFCWPVVATAFGGDGAAAGGGGGGGGGAGAVLTLKAEIISLGVGS